MHCTVEQQALADTAAVWAALVRREFVAARIPVGAVGVHQKDSSAGEVAPLDTPEEVQMERWRSKVAATQYRQSHCGHRGGQQQKPRNELQLEYLGSVQLQGLAACKQRLLSCSGYPYHWPSTGRSCDDTRWVHHHCASLAFVGPPQSHGCLHPRVCSACILQSPLARRRLPLDHRLQRLRRWLARNPSSAQV